MEIQFLEWLQTLHTDYLDTFMRSVTSLGNVAIFWVLLTIVLLIVPKTRLTGLSMAIALALTAFTGDQILKPLIARPRPFVAAGFEELIVSKPTSWSFPSGHTTAAFTTSLTLCYYHRKAGIAALLLAALIAFSRMYLFVHYPTDVLGGICLGAFWSFVTVRVIRPRLDRKLAGTKAAKFFPGLPAAAQSSVKSAQDSRP